MRCSVAMVGSDDSRGPEPHPLVSNMKEIPMRTAPIVTRCLTTRAVAGLLAATNDAQAQLDRLLTEEADRRFEVVETTIPQIQAALDAGQLTCRQLVRQYLRRIRAYDQDGPHLNAIRDLNPRALQIARELDRERRHSGRRGPLHCIPVLLKDNIDTADQPTTAGSVALAGSLPLDDAFMTQRLRDAGAIILGKANLTEFAHHLAGGMPGGFSSLGGRSERDTSEL